MTVRVLIAAAALAAGGAQAATAVSASMSVRADVVVGDASNSDSGTDSWGVPLSSLGVGASTLALDSEGRSGSAHGFGNASWASANQGGVSFEAYGWDFQAPAVKSSGNINNATPDFSYTFIAGAGDAQLSVDYSVKAFGADPFGLWGWGILVSGGPEGMQSWLPSNAFDPTASGNFLAHLTAGSTYTFMLSNNANIGGESGLVISGGMNGSFRWEISAVPEPETYALMALGLGGLVLVSRRRARR